MNDAIVQIVYRVDSNFAKIINKVPENMIFRFRIDVIESSRLSFDWFRSYHHVKQPLSHSRPYTVWPRAIIPE